MLDYRSPEFTRERVASIYRESGRSSSRKLEDELFHEIIKSHKQDYGSYIGDYVGATGSARLKEVHRQGPYMIRESFLYPTGGSGNRLGGLLVPVDKKADTFQDLRRVAYKLKE
jgi:hypothetical protein